VAYDEALAERIRQLVDGEPYLSEKKMFGGLAFLIGGNMAISASGQGGVLVHVNPAETETIISSSDAQMMQMRGRFMSGWLRVSPEHLDSDDQLAKWVRLGVDYAKTLPVKP
jgi:hypothetical protein